MPYREKAEKVFAKYFNLFHKTMDNSPTACRTGKNRKIMSPSSFTELAIPDASWPGSKPTEADYWIDYEGTIIENVYKYLGMPAADIIKAITPISK